MTATASPTDTMTEQPLANRKMTRYRLLAGFHHEGIPGTTDQTILIKAGQTFESEQDWYVDRWPEKFAYAEGTRGEVSGFNWNPAQESLEEFTARMQQLQSAARMKSAQAVTGKTPATDPSSSLANEIENLSTMTVEQLRQYAAEWEIDLQGATKRADILNVVVAGLKAIMPGG